MTSNESIDKLLSSFEIKCIKYLKYTNQMKNNKSYLETDMVPNALVFKKFPEPLFKHDKDFVESHNKIIELTQKNIILNIINFCVDKIEELETELAILKEKICLIDKDGFTKVDSIIVKSEKRLKEEFDTKDKEFKRVANDRFKHVEKSISKNNSSEMNTTSKSNNSNASENRAKIPIRRHQPSDTTEQIKSNNQNFQNTNKNGNYTHNNTLIPQNKNNNRQVHFQRSKNDNTNNINNNKNISNNNNINNNNNNYNYHKNQNNTRLENKELNQQPRYNSSFRTPSPKPILKNTSTPNSRNTPTYSNYNSFSHGDRFDHNYTYNNNNYNNHNRNAPNTNYYNRRHEYNQQNFRQTAYQFHQS